MLVTFVAAPVPFLEIDVSAAGLQTKTKPKVLLIGTGGTIAGVVRNPGGSSYDPGKLTVAAIVAAIPEVKQDIAIFCYLSQDDLWPNAFGAATLSPQHLKILLQLLQATFEAAGKNPTGFRDAVGDFLSKWIPYPNGILPK